MSFVVNCEFAIKDWDGLTHGYMLTLESINNISIMDSTANSYFQFKKDSLNNVDMSDYKNLYTNHKEIIILYDNMKKFSNIEEMVIRSRDISNNDNEYYIELGERVKKFKGDPVLERALDEAFTNAIFRARKSVEDLRSTEAKLNILKKEIGISN